MYRKMVLGPIPVITASSYFVGKVQKSAALHSFTQRQSLLFVRSNFNLHCGFLRWVTTVKDIASQTRNIAITQDADSTKLDAQTNHRCVKFNNPSLKTNPKLSASSMGSLDPATKSLHVSNKSSFQRTEINLDTAKDKRTEPLLAISDLRQHISRAIARIHHFSCPKPLIEAGPVQTQSTTTLEEALHYMRVFNVIFCCHHRKGVQRELKRQKQDLLRGVSMVPLCPATRTLASSNVQSPSEVKKWEERSPSITDSMCVSSPHKATNSDWQLIQTHALLLEWVTLAASRSSRREFIFHRNAISEALLSICVSLEHNELRNRLEGLYTGYDASITATATKSQKQNDVLIDSLWMRSVQRFKLLHRQLGQRGALAYLQVLVIHDSAPRDEKEWRRLSELLLPLPSPSISMQGSNNMLMGGNDAVITNSGNSFHIGRIPFGGIEGNAARKSNFNGSSIQELTAYHVVRIPLLPSGLCSPTPFPRTNLHGETYKTMVEGSVRCDSKDQQNLQLLSIKLSWKDAYALLCWGWAFSRIDNCENPRSTECPMVEKYHDTPRSNDKYRAVHLSSLDVLRVLTKYAQEEGLREDSIGTESENDNSGSNVMLKRGKEDGIKDNNDRTEAVRDTFSQILAHAKRRGHDERVVASLIAQWEQSRTIERADTTLVAACGIDYTVYDRVNIHGKKVVTWKGDHEKIPRLKTSVSARIHQKEQKVTRTLRSDPLCSSRGKDLNELILNQMWEAVVEHVSEVARHVVTESGSEGFEPKVSTNALSSDLSLWCDQQWLTLDEFFSNSLRGVSVKALCAHPSRMLRRPLPLHLVNMPMTNAEQQLLLHPSSVSPSIKAYYRARRRMHSIRQNGIKEEDTEMIKCEREKTAVNLLEGSVQSALCSSFRLGAPPSFIVDLRRRLWILRQLPDHIPRSLVVFTHQGKGLIPFIERSPQKELLPWFLVAVIGLATRLSLSHAATEKYNASAGFGTEPWVKLLCRARQCMAPTLWGQPLPNYAAFSDFCSTTLVELGSQAAVTALRMDLNGGSVNGSQSIAPIESFTMVNANNVNQSWLKAPFTLSDSVEVLLRPPSAAALQMLLLELPHHRCENRTLKVFCTASSSSLHSSSVYNEKLKLLSDTVMRCHTAWQQWKCTTQNEETNPKSHPKAEAVSQKWIEIDRDGFNLRYQTEFLHALPEEVQQLFKNLSSVYRSRAFGMFEEQGREARHDNNNNGVPLGCHCVSSRVFSFLKMQLASLHNYYVSLYLETMALTDATLVQLLNSVGTHMADNGPTVLAPEAAAALTSAFVLHLLPLSFHQNKNENENSDTISSWATTLVEAFGGGFFFVVPADKAHAAQSYFNALYHPSFLFEVGEGMKDDYCPGPRIGNAPSDDGYQSTDSANSGEKTDVVVESLDGAPALLACRSLRIMSKYPTSATEAWFPIPHIIPHNFDSCAVLPSLRLRFMYVDIIGAVQYFMAKSRHTTRAVGQIDNEVHTTSKLLHENGKEVDAVSLVSPPEMLPYGLCAVYKPSGMSTTMHAGFPSLVSPHLMSLLPWQGQKVVAHANISESIGFDNRSTCTKARHTESTVHALRCEVTGEVKQQPLRDMSVSVNEVPVHHQHGLINRIDVGTSGLVLVTQDAASLCQSSYATGVQRRSRKFYRALVQYVTPNRSFIGGMPEGATASQWSVLKSHGYWFLPPRGIITSAVYTNATCSKERRRRHRSDPNDAEETPFDNDKDCSYSGKCTLSSVNPHSPGNFSSSLRNSVADDKRAAITRYRVLKRFPKFGVSYVEVEIITGRRHQVRQHFAQIHHPLLGDDLFHPAYTKGEALVNASVSISGTKGTTDLLSIMPRLALHAHMVDVIGNEAGSRAVVECALPADMQHALLWLRSRS